MEKKGRILSGMRPTGRLHLGNFTGALENWVKLQGEYENFHLVADWHVLTTDCLNTGKIWENTVDMVIDWIGGGIDPEISPIFPQSRIKEHAELHLIFSMLVTVARLERNPAVKEQAKSLEIEENITYGHLGYPVLQASDILIYKANLVPVGEDQLPHIELTREIARRFNKLFGKVFPVPRGKITKFARLPGTDGTRMSKSTGNVILLSDEPEDILAKVRKTPTDTNKIRKGDPGDPDVCTIFTYQKKFNPERVKEIECNCRSGALGCVEDKKILCDKLVEVLEPFRKTRKYYLDHLNDIYDIIDDGTKRAGEVAKQTLEEVRAAMKIG